jgi:hypothetical protein
MGRPLQRVSRCDVETKEQSSFQGFPFTAHLPHSHSNLIYIYKQTKHTHTIAGTRAMFFTPDECLAAWQLGCVMGR